MKFEEALKAMRKGKKVRRKAWGRFSYIKISEGTFVTMFNNEINITNAILHNDWEIVDDAER